jgi:hypothetical protein
MLPERLGTGAVTADEIQALMTRINKLERSVSQTRSILEKLLRELIRKGVCTRDEILRLLGNK